MPCHKRRRVQINQKIKSSVTLLTISQKRPGWSQQGCQKKTTASGAPSSCPQPTPSLADKTRSTTASHWKTGVFGAETCTSFLSFLLDPSLSLQQSSLQRRACLPKEASMASRVHSVEEKHPQHPQCPSPHPNLGMGPCRSPHRPFPKRLFANCQKIL